MIMVPMMKKKKKLKNPGGNIKKHGWEYAGWKIFWGNSPGGSLMGGNFSDTDDVK